MRVSRFLRPPETYLAIFIAGGILLGASSASANDPPPSDPTLVPVGALGWNAEPVTATEEQWEWATDMVLAIYPDSDWATIVYYAESWYNLMPPECTPVAPPPEPTVVDYCTWMNGVDQMLECLFPCCYLCEEQLEMWMLIFYNYLPPWSCY